MSFYLKYLRRIFASLLVAFPVLVRAATALIDGGHAFQTIEGFGINVQTRSWNTNGDLRPVIDAMLDAGMTQFRLAMDNSDWEATNDNSDPASMNWNYYDNAYSAPAFQKMWSVMSYLNQRGITNGIVPNFQGPGPSWLGDGGLAPGFEEEWAEMIASALIYARYTNGLQFTLIEPNNEPDLFKCGVGMTAPEYVASLRALAVKLDNNGLGDVRFIAPDLAYTDTNFMTYLMQDAFVMSKVAHFGVHGYTPVSRGSTGLQPFLAQSAYPDRTFWMTECGLWCNSCQAGTGGDDTWGYAQRAAGEFLRGLVNGASAVWAWEACDSQCLACRSDLFWSLWGLFSLDNPADTAKTYSGRKTFYTLSQFSKFVAPGAQIVDLSGSLSPLSALAFYDAGTGQLTIVGINSSMDQQVLSATLTNLPSLQSLDLYYTTADTNLAHGGTLPLDQGSFQATIPASSVFTLTGPGIPGSHLVIQTNGNGRVSSVAAPPLLSLENYDLVAVPGPGQGFSGWSGSITSASPRLSLTLTQDFVLQASFAPGRFTPTKAIYAGLFDGTRGDTQSISGSVTVSVTRKGNFSGKLGAGSTHYAFTGSFDADGHARVETRRAKDGSVLLDLQADLAHDSKTLTGSLTDGTKTAQLTAERSGINSEVGRPPLASRYTMIVEGRPLSPLAPGGDSYATLRITKSGIAHLQLSLADGTKASQSVAVSHNGTLPLYLSFQGGKGSMWGWITFADTPTDDLRGAVTWHKPPSKHTKYYPDGFTLETKAFGSRYLPADNFLNLTNAEAILQGQALTAPVTSSLTNLASNGKAKNTLNLRGDKLALALSAQSGTFKGAAHSISYGRLQLQGVLLQKQDVARGWFARDSETGQTLLQEPP